MPKEGHLGASVGFNVTEPVGRAFFLEGCRCFEKQPGGKPLQGVFILQKEERVMI